MVRLWQASVPLKSTPLWLDAGTAATYRELHPRRTPSGSAEDQQYASELQVLRDLGMVVEESDGSGGDHVYIAAPRPQEVWSIGLLCGASPIDLHACPTIRNPVLSRDDVTDVPA